MITKRELVVLMNGSMIGTTVTAVDNLTLLARDFNQESIHLFISTWDHDTNNEWLDYILKRVKKLNLNREIIKVTILKEPYNGPSAYSYFHEFQKRLGLESDTINFQVSKRLFYFYTLIKGLEKIEEYNRDCYILRLVSNVDVLVEYPPFTFSTKSISLRNVLIDSYYNKLPKSVPPKYQGIDFSDILFSPHVSPYYVEEKIWITSIATAKKIYSISLEESLDRLTKYYLQLSDKKGVNLNNLTSENISEFFTDRFSTPIDTGITIMHLIQTYAPECLIMQTSEIFMAYNILDGLRNPWLEISLDKVREILPLELPKHPRHINGLPENSKSYS